MSSPPAKRMKQRAQRNIPSSLRPLRVPRANPPPQVALSSFGAASLHSLLRFTNTHTKVKVQNLKTVPIEPN